MKFLVDSGSVTSLLPKKKGTIAGTAPDRYPLPKIEDLLQDYYGATIFSTIDLERGYSVPVTSENVPKTAVTTSFGLFEFLEMPLRFRNASQMFQCHGQCHGHDAARPTFRALLLGRPSGSGYCPPPHRVQAVRDFPLPRTVADLRSFLGMLSFDRRCISGATQLQAPLHEFLRGAKKRNRSEVPWTDDARSAFEACRRTDSRGALIPGAHRPSADHLRSAAAFGQGVTAAARLPVPIPGHLRLRKGAGYETSCMPTILDAATIAEAQDNDDELPHLQDNVSVPLQRLSIEGPDLLCSNATDRVRPYLPSSLRRQAFNVVHGLLHPSGCLTMREASQRFFWLGIKKDVARWARECEPCQRAKVLRHNRSALGSFASPDNRFDHVDVDLIKLPLVAAAFYNNWVCHYGTLLTITLDQGTQFESAFFMALAQLVGAKRIRTAPYHPQSNGMVERLHRSINAALMYSPQSPWPDLLPTVLLGLRICAKQDL
ncbi:uncharacterized protein LOC112589577 [Harpegnathos saltator]|uniref:uncharacterized protein LOC112589577 n=1 Tax=Harpegnathos saltator TaxID=610380 RepID=UPI000DBEDBEB|nr:uncharacterized protein LOC112589577 [Harpegnathos saltator]